MDTRVKPAYDAEYVVKPVSLLIDVRLDQAGEISQRVQAATSCDRDRKTSTVVVERWRNKAIAPYALPPLPLMVKR
jgi:hypothetical protein